MRGRTWIQLTLCLLVVTLAAPTAAGAGVSTSCAIPLPPSSCSFITAVRQLCLGGSHSIVLAPPSTYECSCRCWCRSARPTPPCGTGWLQITVILFTYVPWVGYAYVFLSLLSLDRACYTRCCTPPPSCYCLCYWSACLCCTQTKSSNSACGCFHATPVCAQLCHNAVLRTSYRTLLHRSTWNFYLGVSLIAATDWMLQTVLSASLKPSVRSVPL